MALRARSVFTLSRHYGTLCAGICGTDSAGHHQVRSRFDYNLTQRGLSACQERETMSEHYFCPHHGTDCFDVEDDLGNFCDFGRVHGVEGDRCMNPYE